MDKEIETVITKLLITKSPGPTASLASSTEHSKTWERMYTRGGFMSMYGKTNTVLQSKKIKLKKKKQANNPYNKDSSS